MAATTNSIYCDAFTITYVDETAGTGTQDPQNSFAKATDNATVGEAYTVQEITTLSSGRKSYESSDETVATIDNNGSVTLKKAGETTITVTTAADDNYAEGSASYTLIVEKGTPVLSFAQETVTAYLGTDQNGPKLTNPGDGAVTYEISDPNIATIQSKGYIHPIAAGTATVTANTAETEAWLSATASYTLKVEETFHVDAAGTYELVTDASTLKDGDQILISYITSSSVGSVLGAKQTNNFDAQSLNYGAISADKSTFEVTTEEVTPFILEGSAGAWYFHVKDGYLCATSDSKNNLGVKTLSAAGDNAKANISINNGNATIKFLGTYTRNLLKYNSSNTLFSCYNSSSDMKLVQLYRKIDTQTPPTVTFSPESGTEVNYGTQVTISARTATSITYSVNDGEPVKVEGTSATVTINTNSTIKVKATNEYGTSEETTAEYTIHAESPAFTYDPDEYTITFGDEFKAPELGKAADYDGTVTFASDNAEVAEVDAETGDVTVKGAGTAVITATGTATEHFEAATASYTLTVNKQASAVSFAEPVVEITYGDNYDKQKATAEGFSGDLVYSSSDESVVKFHGNGVIDVLGPGTVTITATAPATETTEESSATYTLKIYEPADASEGVTEVLNEDFSSCNGTSTSFGGSSGFANVPTDLGWETSYCQAGPQYLKLGNSSNAGVATSPAFSVVGEAPLSFALAPWIANNNTENATVTVSLTNATFDNGSSSIELSTKDLVQREFTTFDQYKIVGNSEAVQITFTSGGSYERFFLDDVVVGGGAQPAHEINLTFSSAGYLTWVATADIDFTQTTGVTAYKITEATPKKITMVEVDKVKKGEAVMLKGSGTVQLTRTTGAEAFTDNKMLACSDGRVTGNGVNGETQTDVYVLGNGKNGLGFYMLKGTLQAGKGYLRVTEEAGNAKQSFIGFEVVTGVNAVEAKDADDAAIYNLQGVRVAHPQKGIYVKNGKKFIIK
ncbi:MAG: Ig-like domain-containing protein [Prevotella sp.]|nr:Ig-like domain-containing protein [Prevotella sp.]